VQQYRYGSSKKIQFKITKDGVGVAANLVKADVRLYNDGVYVDIDITSQIVAVDSFNAPGFFVWTPGDPSRTDCEIVTLIIRNVSGGTPDFDENMVGLITGGDPDAYLDAT